MEIYLFVCLFVCFSMSASAILRLAKVTFMWEAGDIMKRIEQEKK
jgi:hypothetical protein